MLDQLNQLKDFIKANESEIVLFFGVILVSLISFAFGRMTAPSPLKQPITISDQQAFIAENSALHDSTEGLTAQDLSEKISGEFVASKNSTKYHLSDCPGAKRIAEHNKIWFSSREEAESVGYTPAANCPGL